MSSILDRLYSLAEPQLGYFTTAQAQRAGVSRQELYYLRQRGDLVHAAHGIQRLARFPADPHEDIAIACLWAGAGAVASHETALVVYEIGDVMPATVHVTVPAAFRGRRRGVTVHVARLDADDIAHRNGIPVTTPLRSVADVAAGDPSGARRALSDALERGIVSSRDLEGAASRNPYAASVFEVRR